MNNYPDLSQAADASSNYPDLSSPMSSPSPETNSVMDNVKSVLRKILPTPQVPLGMNVASGVLSTLVPPAQRNMLEQVPQIMSGENYGVPQKIASGVGETIPAMMAGGASLPGQAASGFAMGAAGAPEGQRLKSGAENALLTTGIGKVLPVIGKSIGNIFGGVDNKSMAKNIQAIHDEIDNRASQGFQDVSKGVSDRNISQVPLQLSVMNDLSNAVKSGYLPRKKQINDMIGDALSGDYNALRQMQSELWRKGTKAASSNSIADNNLADEIFDLRDRINNNISHHLLSSGHEDLNAVLNQSRAGYKYLQDTFYNKNVPTQFKKMVNPEIRQIPKNLGTLLQTDSKPMEKVRNAISINPEKNWLGKNNLYSYPTDIQAYNFKKNIKPILKGLGYTGFGLAETAALYKLIYPHHSGNGGLPQDLSE